MTARRDPFETLRDHNPVDPSTLPDAATPHARRLLATITATDRINLARRRRVRRIIAIAVAALIIAAAAWAILTRDVTQPLGTACYEEADLESKRVGVRPEEQPTVDLCADLWRNGTLTNPQVPQGTVPELQGCVNQAGGLAVVPSDNRAICEQLGLTNLNPEPVEPIDAEVELQTRLIDYFSTSGCVDIDTATNEAADILIELGLNDWTVTTQPPHPQRPCSSFGLDTANKQVVLVPIPSSSAN